MKPRRMVRAFSLLEMMLVVAIIGILMTLVIINVGGVTEKAQRKTTMAKMLQVKNALATYAVDYGSLPPTEMGLQVLVTTKAIDVVPADAWKKPMRYMFPGTSGNPDRPYDLQSAGKDGIFGTADDLNIWTTDPQSGETIVANP